MCCLPGYLIAERNCRPGELATNIIKKFGGKTTSTIINEINEFMAKSGGKPKDTPHADEANGSGMGAFNAVLGKSKALICSRGRHGGEISAQGFKIPCVSSCAGATEQIASGQAIVVDAGRGEVYDVRHLQNYN